MANRSKRPTTKGSAPGPRGSYDDDEPTEVEDIDPTDVDTPRAPPAEPVPGDSAPKFRAISLKTPGAQPVRREKPVAPVHVQLRQLSDITPTSRPQNLGNLAPPYDPVAARKRSIREHIMWICVAVILASVIALVVWFVAR